MGQKGIDMRVGRWLAGIVLPVLVLLGAVATPAAALPIAGLVAFLDEAVDVFLDGVRQERPVTHFSG